MIQSNILFSDIDHTRSSHDIIKCYDRLSFVIGEKIHGSFTEGVACCWRLEEIL